MGARHALRRLDDLILDDVHRLDHKVVGAPPPLTRETQRQLRAMVRQAQAMDYEIRRQRQEAERINAQIVQAYRARVQAYARERQRR